jgi:UTP pyrophosphatase
VLTSPDVGKIPLKEEPQHMHGLKYLAGYSEKVTTRVEELIAKDGLGSMLLARYPAAHEVKTDRALYEFTVDIKNEFLRKSQPLSKVAYDCKINVLNNALGMHSFVSRIQGAKLKSKHEIRIASVFKDGPIDFLRMIVVHELAHLKEKEHNKPFYQLCEYMEPAYHQLEFDTRLFLTHIESSGSSLYKHLTK